MLTGFLLSAQKRSATLSAKTIGVNERVTLTIEAESDQITSYFSMPTSPGVMIVGDYSNQSNVNGKTRLIQQYTLLALLPGTWTLGPFVATGRSGNVRIQAVTLVVTGQPPSSQSSAISAFLQCDIPRRTYFEGEQIIADIRVYVPEGEDVDKGAMPLSSPSYVGFWHERGPDGYAFRDTTIVKNGKRYTGKTILREFLFATRTGALTIPAFNYQCGI
ncbi:MAG: BatD family protein, partial [Bacteroidia bacterium]